MKFTKQLLIVLLLTISMAYSVEAFTIRLVQVQNIPDFEDLIPDLEFVLTHESHLTTYIVDEHWKYELSKQELGNRLISFSKTLGKIVIDEENQDLILLKGLIAHYLFNLDYQEYHDIAIEEYEKIDDYSYRDYRYKWFLGVHYAKSVKPFKSIEQFEYVEAKVPEDKVHPEFWADYAEALLFASMHRKSIEAFEKFSKYGSVDLTNNSLYQSLKEKEIKLTPDEELNGEDIYQVYRRESGLGFLCRPFNIWIPAKGEWTPRKTDYKNNSSGLMYKSQTITDKNGEEITYSILSMMYVDNDGVENQFRNMTSDITELEVHDFDQRYTVLEYKDPSKYQHIGGSHGYILIYEPEEGEVTGLDVEVPAKIASETLEGSAYFALKPIYQRMPGKISYVFLLDSCENIFEESKSDFIDFMDKVIIE